MMPDSKPQRRSLLSRMPHGGIGLPLPASPFYPAAVFCSKREGDADA